MSIMRHTHDSGWKAMAVRLTRVPECVATSMRYSRDSNVASKNWKQPFQCVKKSMMNPTFIRRSVPELRKIKWSWSRCT